MKERFVILGNTAGCQSSIFEIFKEGKMVTTLGGMKRMVSLKNIAEELGVSVATVSKALNDGNDISEKTKKRVTEKAREMGYLPNAAAKALKTRRTQNIGVLFTDEANSGLTHDYFSRVLDSFKRTVEDAGYDITFVNCSKNRPKRLSYLEHVRYRGFDGIMIANISFQDPEVIELMNSGIPIVTVDYPSDKCTSILSDNVKGIETLFEYIYQMGHRKIAFIHGADSAVTKARLGAFLKTATDHGITILGEYIAEAPYRSTSVTATRVRELLTLDNPPTCIICPDDFAAFGALNVLHEQGLAVGKDISIAGYDGIPIARRISPALTTIRQDTETIGAMAGEHLVAMIEKPEENPPQKFMVPAVLFEGGSVGRISL